MLRILDPTREEKVHGAHGCSGFRLSTGHKNTRISKNSHNFPCIIPIFRDENRCSKFWFSTGAENKKYKKSHNFACIIAISGGENGWSKFCLLSAGDKNSPEVSRTFVAGVRRVGAGMVPGNAVGLRYSLSGVLLGYGDLAQRFKFAVPTG